MHISACCTLAATLALAGAAIAQPMGALDDRAPCQAQKADIESRMDLARSKGRMLLRQQLAEQLATLQKDCKAPSADQGEAANIQRLEKEVRALQAELELAQEQLRKLKGETSR